ncbi:hypothetical protein B0J11DRAFT_526605 [Dendryphion nanum]|uniref:RRM domain-containing protein n=1 Tax=Dendryphion nanum TaxID=256645 RepID=A0A9P9DX57_9PLEO|nr:hypothetical protein B0J11DRAFT_526605 [Dendryphion nanum]
MASMEYESEQRGYDDEPRGYERDRSRSPRGDRRELDDSRARSASPNGRDTRGALPIPNRLTDEEDEEGARNPGSNLFVTGIHPNLSEEEVTRLFEKYGEVEKCNIMRDPHSKESRGFGFVKMVTPEQADAAKEGLQGEVHQGRTLSIEKARRSRPRIPTPGKYYGPPKRGNVTDILFCSSVLMTSQSLEVVEAVAAAAVVVVVDSVIAMVTVMMTATTTVEVVVVTAAVARSIVVAAIEAPAITIARTVVIAATERTMAPVA